MRLLKLLFFSLSFSVDDSEDTAGLSRPTCVTLRLVSDGAINCGLVQDDPWSWDQGRKNPRMCGERCPQHMFFPLIIFVFSLLSGCDNLN